jgi:hypothetical protein
MTLRLSDADAELLREQAEAEGISQHEAAVRAIRARSIARIAAEGAARYRTVLGRLGEA